MNLGRSQTNQQRNTDVQTPTPASLQCSRLTPPLTRKGEPTGRAAFVEPMLHVNEKDKLTLLFFLKKHPSPILSTMATLLCSASPARRRASGAAYSSGPRLRDENRFSETSSRRCERRSRLEPRSCLQSGERERERDGDAAAPHPAFLSPAGGPADRSTRRQRRCTLPAGLRFKRQQVWVRLWHRLSLVRFNWVQAWKLSNKTRLEREREGGGV